MTRLVHLVRPGGAVDAAIARDGDEHIRIELPAGAPPIYVSAEGERIVERTRIIELLLGADGVIVW